MRAAIVSSHKIYLIKFCTAINSEHTITETKFSNKSEWNNSLIFDVVAFNKSSENSISCDGV